MTEAFKRVAVGMSGGVDSSTSAYLLQQQGYDVVGVSAITTGKDNESSHEIIKDASSVCEILGIEHYVCDLTDVFKEKIINYFLDTYSKGRTPNPCVVCNKTIKWGALYEYARHELDCNYLATGHYAVIEELEGYYRIKRSKDKAKDQTYMLVNLTQEDLSHTIFPLGHFEKEEIKKIANENNLPTANRKESQDVCFIVEPEKTQEYLEKNLGIKPGKIIDCSNDKIIGEHTGIYRFTVGQRRGIKVAYPYPLYVVSIDTENNNVYVGAKEDIESNNLIASDINWVEKVPTENKFYALCKIRYNSPAKLAQIELIDDTTVNIEFEQPRYAITPGQVAAFYTLDNQYLIGGGWIQ